MSKEFFFNPNNPKKSFDVYKDKDKSDTIPIKYSNMKDVKNSIKLLESLYKKGKYNHRRISQVAMIMTVRLRVIKNMKTDKPKIRQEREARFELSEKYSKFLKSRTKEKDESKRKKLSFKLF
tara:strand:- start:3889 stop:4254 length:366 start_codon:yes stop_codon:yes gene_type:complete